MKEEKKTVSKWKNIWKFNTVKKKLIVSMTALAIIPTVLLGIVSNQITQNVMKEQIASASLQTTTQIDHSINNFLLGAESQLNLLANNINFTQFHLNPDNKEYGFYLLEGTGKSQPDYQAVFFASAEKDFVLYPRQVLPDGYDPTEREWYREAVNANGKVVIGNPYQDATTKKTVITISQAVISQGEVVGVVGIDLNLQKLSKETNQVIIGKNGHSFILAKDGTAITHNDGKIVGTKEQTKLKLWKDVSAKLEGYSEYEYKGVENFSSFTTNKQTGWKIISTLEQKEIEDSSNAIELISLIMMVAIALISTLIAYLIGRKIAGNLNIIQTAFKTASEGDLTTRVTIKTKDEFKELEKDFNHMMDELSLSLKNVEESSKHVLQTSSNLSAMTAETSASVYEVAQAIGEIAQGTNLQADNAQTSASQIQELSERLNGISHSTNEMNELSQQSTQLGNKGLEQVGLLTEKSNQTKQATVEIGQIVKEVESKMEEINKFIDTISGITGETNMLALNAQIESAKAKEFGRGFAVVADRVRNLAEQSKKSATEIKQVVDSIKAVVQKAVMAMEQTQHIVGEQEVAVSETKEIFTEILHSIDNMVKKSDEVKESLTESQQNKEMVVKEIESISAVSQQTASATEEVSASAEEISATMEEFNRHANGLEGLSKKLDTEIKKFKLK